jgi:hypothetical protein
MPLDALIELIVSALDHVITVWVHGARYLMESAEDNLRVPLHDIGLHGAAETFAVAMVPILSLIAAMKIFRGIIRGVAVVVLVTFATHALWPLVSEIPMMMRGTVTAQSTTLGAAPSLTDERS